MKLWLVRHARPLIEPGICYGGTDVAADPQATQACALSLAQALPKRLPARVSALSRARQLADAVSVLRPDLSFVVDERLNEMHFGCWEGVPWDAIPQQAFDAWMADFAHHRFGGTESLDAVLKRVDQALAESGGAAEAVWITHAGVIRAVAYLLQHGAQSTPQPAGWPVQAPGYGAWTTVDAVNRPG